MNLRADKIEKHQWKNLKAALGWKGTGAMLERHLRLLSLPTYYPVYCAWCAEEGRENRTGWSETEHAGGICTYHRELLELGLLEGGEEI